MTNTKLAAYSLLSTTFLALDNDAKGQVWHKDYFPDILVQPTTINVFLDPPCSTGSTGYGSFPIDLNQDGVYDLGVTVTFGYADNCGYPSVHSEIRLKMFGANRVAWTNTFVSSELGARRFLDGQMIDSSLDFSLPTGADALLKSFDIDYGGWGYNYGSWAGFSYGAAGVRIEISGQHHFGWIRLNPVGAGADKVYVLDYMLNANPNEAIEVGADPCQRPFELSAALLSPTSVELSWSPIFNGVLYQIRAREVGTTNVQIGQSDTFSKVAVGLMPSTTYEWQVRARCADGSNTPWSPLNTFSTP